jgi:hypothetical protein
MGIGKPGEERFREDERFQFGLVGKFGFAPAGRFHEDIHVAIFCKGRQIDEVRPSSTDFSLERAAFSTARSMARSVDRSSIC